MNTEDLINKLHIQSEHTASQQEVFIYGKALAILKGSKAFNKQDVIKMLENIMATGYKQKLIEEVIACINSN